MKTLCLKSSFWRRILVFCLALGLALSSFPLAIQSSEAATQPGYNGKIVLTSGNCYSSLGVSLLLVEGDGSGSVVLASNRSCFAQISPDGSRFIFISKRDGHLEIYVMNADGSGQTRLTNSLGDNLDPQWSPDGSKIAFISSRDGGNREIYVMDADGGNQTRLTNAINSDVFPRWSPDGSSIIFESGREGYSQIYRMNANGSNQVNLSNNSNYNYNPQWSPDGSKIAFTSGGSGVGYDLYLMNVDGSNQVNVSSTSRSEYDADVGYFTWSPDGSEIVFVWFDRDWRYSTLVVMNADGSNVREHDFASQGVPIIEEPVWSPDGKKIVITGWSDGWGSWDTYVVDVSSANLTQLTHDGISGYGSWLSIPNTPPTATADSAVVSLNTPKLVDVLANDTDEEPLSGQYLTIATQPSHGSAYVESGKIRYAPANNYVGSDSLTYQICDSFLLDQKCSSAVLSLTVQERAAVLLEVNKVGSQSFDGVENKYLTTALRPTFSGTATPGASIRIEIHSDPIILTTTADNQGYWSVTPDQDLPSGEHTVYISATLNGQTTTLDSFVLGVQREIPNTGGDSSFFLLGGLMLLILGCAGLVWDRRHRQVGVPELFPDYL